MERESVFLGHVRSTFKKWAGFQAAINEGMGGPHAKEKEIWIAKEIENYFKTYADVQPDEIEEYLGTMIENEFDTYFEDGSLQEVSKNFCTAYPITSLMPNHRIIELIPTRTEILPVVVLGKITPEEMAAKQMERLAVADNAEADGWTTVMKKNRKKSEKLIPL